MHACAGAWIIHPASHLLLSALQTAHFDQRLSCTFFLHPEEEGKGSDGGAWAGRTNRLVGQQQHQQQFSYIVLHPLAAAQQQQQDPAELLAMPVVIVFKQMNRCMMVMLHVQSAFGCSI